MLPAFRTQTDKFNKIFFDGEILAAFKKLRQVFRKSEIDVGNLPAHSAANMPMRTDAVLVSCSRAGRVNALCISLTAFTGENSEYRSLTDRRISRMYFLVYHGGGRMISELFQSVKNDCFLKRLSFHDFSYFVINNIIYQLIKNFNRYFIKILNKFLKSKLK